VTASTASPNPSHLPFFVYGTLRVGQGNYGYLLRGKTINARPATFTGGLMYDNGGFPFVVHAPEQPAGLIHGDLVDVRTTRYAQVLTDLDALEGYVPGRARNMYERIEVDVQPAEGAPVRAHMYVAAPAMYPRIQTLDPIPSGDWVADGR
jgi:gamma-glutamylcyclotransferase (GGCT)/AIG2-like uncharacterized protein YtfP